MIDVALAKRQGPFRIDVAFRAEGPTVTALFGRSGAGKTSLINMVAGLVRPDAGHVTLDGRALFDAERKIDLPVHRRRIGYVFQEGRLFPHYTVRSNLLYGRERVPAAERFIAFDEVVELLGIAPLLDRRPARLSGGEKQRVAIGRALLSCPRLLLMDEPLASLDGARKAELLPFIAQLPRLFRLPILYVSHSVDEVLQLADDLVLLEEGRVAAAGPVEQVMSLPAFAAVTGGDSQLATVIAATVRDHDAARATTHLAFPGGVISVPRLAAAPGSGVRVRIEAANVILARSEPRGLSVRNIFHGQIRDLQRKGGMVDVLLDVGCPLQAQVTAEAALDLELAVGLPVYALVKTASLSRGDLAERSEG